MKRAMAARTLLAACLCAAPLAASTIPKLDLAEMVAQSALIVVGTAMAAEPVWIGNELYTRYTIEVEETLFGTGTPRVTVLVPGGVDRNRRIPIAVAVDGAPLFLPRERALLLLGRIATTGDHRVVGLNQGRFTIDAPRAGEGLAPPAPATAARSPRLDALRARLDRLIRQRRSGQLPAASQRPGGQR